MTTGIEPSIERFKQHLTGLIEQSVNPVLFLPPEKRQLIVAYSGGLDSHALLHLVKNSGFNLRAIYVDHGLQPESTDWAQHCRQQCETLEIPFMTISVNAQPVNGESPEAAARTARYQALAEQMTPGDILLTAQHRQDQAETLLLQLLRSAGPEGLAAMPACKPFAGGFLLRPLLEYERPWLERYARQAGLQWVEDPSNQQTRYDRNYLRHEVIPVLRERWPSFEQTLSTAASLQAEAAELLQQLAAIDAAGCVDGNTLEIDGLLRLTAIRQKNLLRYWLKQLGLERPPAARLQQILDSVIPAAEDAAPVVAWGNGTTATEVRRFQGRLYAMPSPAGVDRSQQYSWQGESALLLPAGAGTLQWEQRTTGLSRAVVDAVKSVRYRQGGEKLKPAGRSETRPLKKLLQEASIPPWDRENLLLLFLDDKLVAVANLWVAEPFCNKPGEAGFFPVHRR